MFYGYLRVLPEGRHTLQRIEYRLRLCGQVLFPSFDEESCIERQYRTETLSTQSADFDMRVADPLCCELCQQAARGSAVQR